MLLFVFNRSWDIFGNAQETFVSLRLKKKTQASALVTIFLRQWIKGNDWKFLWKPFQIIEGKQHKKVQWEYFQIIAFANFGNRSQETFVQFFSLVLDNRDLTQQDGWHNDEKMSRKTVHFRSCETFSISILSLPAVLLHKISNVIV